MSNATGSMLIVRAAALAAIVLMALAFIGNAATASAQTTITVNDTGDPGSSAGGCTLRDAISIAEGGSASNGDSCASTGSGSPYTIVFSVSGIIDLANPLPIAGNLTITGPAASPGITIDGQGDFQLMRVVSGATLNLQFLTMQNGSAAFGGAIANGGKLTVTSCTFLDNQATGFSGAGKGGEGGGGAIVNSDTLTVIDSTFAGNKASGGNSGAGNLGGNAFGGAIMNLGQGLTLTVVNSTFNGNQATGGVGGPASGGIPADDGGPGEGGAIYNQDSNTLSVTNCTFSGNQAIGGAGGVGGGAMGTGAGGGVYNGFNGTTASLKGTILANSTGGNCGGLVITDAGYNISDDMSCKFIKTGAANNGDGVDPLLVALADNGGFTLTMALMAGSPAIDAIPLASCTDQAASPSQITTDQRNFPRPDPADSPPACDIGAYESGAVGPTPTPTPTPTQTSTPTPTFTATPTPTPTPAPVAQCQDLTVGTDPNVCVNSEASINNGSFDPDGDALKAMQSPAPPYKLGQTSVTLTVSEASGASASCNGTITVVDRQAPSISCPAPVVECTSPSGAVVSFGASASDNCPNLGTPTCTPDSGTTFPLGSTSFSCMVADGSGNTASCNSSVKVQDTIPPSISSVAANPSVLWPPNHKLVPIAVSVMALDTCDPHPNCGITAISANEPLAPGDTQITGSLTAMLAASRLGGGSGRTYTINLRCGDVSGNSSTANATVFVPLRAPSQGSSGR